MVDHLGALQLDGRATEQGGKKQRGKLLSSVDTNLFQGARNQPAECQMAGREERSSRTKHNPKIFPENETPNAQML